MTIELIFNINWIDFRHIFVPVFRHLSVNGETKMENFEKYNMGIIGGDTGIAELNPDIQIDSNI